MRDTAFLGGKRDTAYFLAGCVMRGTPPGAPHNVHSTQSSPLSAQPQDSLQIGHVHSSRSLNFFLVDCCFIFTPRILVVHFFIEEVTFFFSLWIFFLEYGYKAVAWQKNLAKATAILEIYNILP